MKMNLFFDLDRTLWDFEKNSEQALRLLFEKYKLADYFINFSAFHTLYTKINHDLWELYRFHKIQKEVLRVKRFADTLKIAGVENPKIALGLANDYVQISPRQTQLFPGTKEVLTSLREKDCRLHIITNGFKEVQHIKLNNSGLSHFFEVVLCSEEVGKNKPHQDVFKAALKKANASSKHSIMIGDDYEADIIGAKKVGMGTVLFDPNKTNANNSETRIIHSLSELLEKPSGLLI